MLQNTLVRCRIVLLAPVLLVAGLVGCGSNQVSDADIEAISLTEFRGLMEGKNAEKVMIVDPRAKSDFDQGHIPGAKNLGINQERAKSGGGLNPLFRGYKTIVVYDADPIPGPAVAMTKRLMLAGADEVRLFRGGLVEWKRAGLRVEQTAEAAPPTAPK